jgi:hypothetical protein
MLVKIMHETVSETGMKQCSIGVCTDLDLVTQIMFGSGPGSNDTNQMLYRTFQAFSDHSFFYKEKVICSCAHLMLVTQLGSRNKSHRLDFLRDFRSCPLPKIVQGNTLHTWHPISLYWSLNSKITSDVLTASLNNLFQDYWHLCIKRRMC